MAVDALYSGSALRAVSADGRTRLPDFVRRTIERRADAALVVFGPHEADPCISGYDEGREAALHAELERRRLRDEESGDRASHHGRARRVFGAAERAGFDAQGRVTLPPMARRKGRIADLALFVGTGGSFEIWNPHLAREAPDAALRELAEYALAQAEHGKGTR